MPAKRSATRKKPAAANPIDAYLAKVDPPKRAALQTLRKQIHSAAPGITEGLSYQMPAFSLDGRGLVAFAAFRDHCSLFPMSGSLIASLAPQLKRFVTSKGTIRFTVDAPLPATLVRKIVKARIAQTAKRPARKR